MNKETYLQHRAACEQHMAQLKQEQEMLIQKRAALKQRMEVLRQGVMAMPDGDEKTRCIAHFKAFDEEQARFEVNIRHQDSRNNLLMEIYHQNDAVIQQSLAENSTSESVNPNSVHDLEFKNLEFKMMMGPQENKHVLDFQRDNPSMSSYKEAEYMLWKLTGGHHRH